MTRAKPTEKPLGSPSEGQTDNVPSNPSTPLAGLPSANLKHAVVLRAELENRLSQFEAGIAALQAEVDGQQTAHESQLSDLNTKHEEAVAEMTQRHGNAKGDLLRRIEDLRVGQMMLTRALDKGEEE